MPSSVSVYDSPSLPTVAMQCYVVFKRYEVQISPRGPTIPTDIFSVSSQYQKTNAGTVL
jgi:hypothetical protein